MLPRTRSTRQWLSAPFSRLDRDTWCRYPEGTSRHSDPRFVEGQRTLRREFETTMMLEAAIATAAKSGLMRPATASGIATAL
jgi:hypothetical protein